MYDPQYALRLCTEHEQTRACVLIYAAMGLYEESVDHALEVGGGTCTLYIIHVGGKSGWSYMNVYMYICTCNVLMRDEKERRKKEARSNKYKAKQHSTPKAVTSPKKN